MKYNLIIRDEADEETIKSFLWYEDQRQRLGEEFLRQIENGLDEILSHPLLYQKIYKQYRQFPLRQFPFVIIYELEGNFVIVYSVFHTSRNPKQKFRK